MNKGVGVGVGVGGSLAVVAFILFRGFSIGPGAVDPPKHTARYEEPGHGELTDANQEAILNLSVRGSGIYAGGETLMTHEEAVELALTWSGQGPDRIVHVQITSSALESAVTNLQEDLTQRGVTYFVQPTRSQ